MNVWLSWLHARFSSRFPVVVFLVQCLIRTQFALYPALRYSPVEWIGSIGPRCNKKDIIYVWCCGCKNGLNADRKVQVTFYADRIVDRIVAELYVQDLLLYVMRQLRCALQNWSLHAVRTPILQSTRRQFANEETVDTENCRRGGQCRPFGIDWQGDSSTRKQLTRSNVDMEST